MMHRHCIYRLDMDVMIQLIYRCLGLMIQYIN